MTRRIALLHRRNSLIYECEDTEIHCSIYSQDKVSYLSFFFFCLSAITNRVSRAYILIFHINFVAKLSRAPYARTNLNKVIQRNVRVFGISVSFRFISKSSSCEQTCRLIHEIISTTISRGRTHSANNSREKTTKTLGKCGKLSPRLNYIARALINLALVRVSHISTALKRERTKRGV